MQKWEYKVLKRGDLSQAKLNELGADGWELMPMVLPQCNIPNSFDEIEVEPGCIGLEGREDGGHQPFDWPR